MADELNYSDLRNRQQEEDNAPGITRLDPDFYRQVRERIAELREEYRRAHDEDPSHQRTLVLLDSINKMEDTLEELYHVRQRKIFRAAIARARGGSPETENMTPVEEDLFDDLVATLTEHKEEVLEGDPLTEPAPEPETEAEPAPDPADDEPDQAGVEPAEEETGDAEPAGDGGVERVMIRVLDDLDPFVATDMATYDLAEDDVVNLPVEQARLLCRRGQAVELDAD